VEQEAPAKSWRRVARTESRQIEYLDPERQLRMRAGQKSICATRVQFSDWCQSRNGEHLALPLAWSCPFKGSEFRLPLRSAQRGEGKGRCGKSRNL